MTTPYLSSLTPLERAEEHLRGAEAYIAYLRDELTKLQEKSYGRLKSALFESVEVHRQAVVSQNAEALAFHMRRGPVLMMPYGAAFDGTPEERRELAWKLSWDLAKKFEPHFCEMLRVWA